MARLTVKLGKKKQQTIELDVDEFSIGRGSAAGLRLDHELISREHCRIRNVADKLVLEDLQSTSGTFVNEKKVAAHVLKDGDVIGVGPYSIIFAASDGPAVGDEDAAAAFWSNVASAEGVRLDEKERKNAEEQDDAVPASAMPEAPEFAQSADWDGTVPASTTQIERVREQLLASQKPHFVVTTKKGVQRVMLESMLVTFSNQRGADFRLPGGPFSRKNGFMVRRTAKGGYEIEPLDGNSRVQLAGSKLESTIPLADGVIVEAQGLKFRYREGS